jgi:hypothetical protein
MSDKSYDLMEWGLKNRGHSKRAREIIKVLAENERLKLDLATSREDTSESNAIIRRMSEEAEFIDVVDTESFKRNDEPPGMGDDSLWITLRLNPDIKYPGPVRCILLRERT